MSSFGGTGGGRTRMSTKVYLNVYDLSPMNDMLYPVGFGLHHTGVEIMGTEYSFASGAGIFESSPKEAPNAKFREQIDMGTFDGGQSGLKSVISDLRSVFGPDDYNLIRRNCNHFANALCWKLLNKRIPGYINRLADIGVCCSCLLPKKLLENAPVGDTNNPSGSGTNPFLVKAPSGRQMAQTVSSGVKAFHGQGMKLGGSSLSSSSSNNTDETSSLLSRFSSSSTTTTTPATTSSRQDDLTDRREKARKAALARLEKQQLQNDSDKSQ